MPTRKRRSLVTRIRRWWATHAAVRDVARKGVRVWLMSFLGLTVPGLLGWLHGLTEWATSQGQAPFPDATSLAYLAVAAVGSSSVALVNVAWNALENRAGKGVLRDVPFSKVLEQDADARARRSSQP